MPSRALILFAHGAREPGWARPLELVRDRLRAAGTTVELAYLELMPPSLAEAAARLARAGFAAVTIVPLFLAQGKHLKRDLPAMVDSLRKRHAGVEFSVTAALGEAPEVQAAIAAWIQRATRLEKTAPAGRRALKKKNEAGR
jgi:sirohydrochlorin cobaltochelatase